MNEEITQQDRPATVPYEMGHGKMFYYGFGLYQVGMAFMMIVLMIMKSVLYLFSPFEITVVIIVGAIYLGLLIWFVQPRDKWPPLREWVAFLVFPLYLIYRVYSFFAVFFNSSLGLYLTTYLYYIDLVYVGFNVLLFVILFIILIGNKKEELRSICAGVSAYLTIYYFFILCLLLAQLLSVVIASDRFLPVQLILSVITLFCCLFVCYKADRFGFPDAFWMPLASLVLMLGHMGLSSFTAQYLFENYSGGLSDFSANYSLMSIVRITVSVLMLLAMTGYCFYRYFRTEEKIIINENNSMSF